MLRFLLLLALVVSSSSLAAEVRYFPQIGAGGGGPFQFETTVSLVNTGAATRVALDFFDPGGQPLALAWDPWGEAASFTLDLAAGQTVIGHAAGSGNLRTGYARVTAPAAVDGNAVFAGTDIPSGVALFEAGVPLTPAAGRSTVLVDSLGSRNTGLALVHSPIPGAAENTPAQLTFRLYDSSYQLLGTVSRTLDPGSQIAQFVNEIFGADPTVSALAAEMRGSLEVEAEGASVAAVTLRQLQTSQAFPGQVPTLTTFPVVISAPATPEWQLVWSDEFDGDSLDLSKWEYEIGRGPQNDGWGNRELQYYTNRAENLRVADGTLKIIATNDPYRVTIGNNSTTYTYTSARIRTKDKGDWKYGRFEFRAKLPEGKGIWPAIWMLPTDNVYGTWAASGEIDIMEMVGHEPNRVHGTLHYGGMWPNNIYDGMSYGLREGKFSESFHDFALEWEDGEMRWYVDGVLYVRQTWWKTAGHPFPAPFDQRFHLLINMAVGGNWPGSPDATTQFPQKLEVDYVRVYQRTPAD